LTGDKRFYIDEQENINDMLPEFCTMS